MKLTIVSELLLLMFLCYANVVGQHKSFRILKQYNEPVVLRLVRNDSLLVNCDSAFVYNKQAQGEMRRKDSLIAAYTSRVALGDSIRSLKDSVIFMYRQIAMVQNQSYDTLRARFTSADSLARVSVANTNEALSYITRVKASSFVASGLAGGILGGLAIKNDSDKKFDWGGAGAGALLGVGINWLLLKVLN
jgi:hypothetical protein